jgi:hypothetical protein
MENAMASVAFRRQLGKWAIGDKVRFVRHKGGLMSRVVY